TSTQYRPQTNGSLSYFKRGWGTSHNFKVGWEVAQQQDVETQFGLVSREGPIGQPDLMYTLNNGAPTQVTFSMSPSHHFTYEWWTAGYVNDSWQLNDHLSFNLGVRWDRYRNGYPEIVQPRDQF